jgi:hypothetical protein
MTIETFQRRFRTQMKHNAGHEFEVGCDKVDNVPFKLEMSNSTVVLAPYHPPIKTKVNDGIPCLQMDQFRTAISALYKIGEGRKIRDDEIPHGGEFLHAINSINDPEL